MIEMTMIILIFLDVRQFFDGSFNCMISFL